MCGEFYGEVFGEVVGGVSGNVRRAIRLRKANIREVTHYAKND